MLPRPCVALLFVLFLNNIRVFDAASADPRTFTVDADVDSAGGDGAAHGRQRRQAASSTPTDKPNVITKINHLNDTHKQLKVHWCKQKAVVCLAKDPPGTVQVTPSSVYVSYDYGDTYVDKTGEFKLDNGSLAITEKFFVHPEYDANIIFSDPTNKAIFVTADTGRTIKRVNLKFTPSEISFHKFQPQTFLAYDTVDPDRPLWMTTDFGQSWRQIQEHVKSYFWIEDKSAQQQLVFERVLPSNLSTVFYTNKQQKLNMYALEVEKVVMKNDYIFTAMKNKRHSYDVYVSYKFGKKLKCVFDTNLLITDYLVVDVDVEAHRAFVAVSHTSTMSNLYVSENLGGRDDKVHFTLSMDNIMAHFPNTTWKNSWLHIQAEEAFADVYRVEGLAGIYIASQIVLQPNNSDIGPHNLASRITFDHGASWRPIAAPLFDMEGQRTGCAPEANCSLHLSQKFSQLYPDTRSYSIVSSKSAPGVIMATGVMGASLKGHFGMFVSSDAGITWRYAIRDFYFFNVGDHGGVMVASENLLMLGKVRHLLYSTSEGERWLETPFHDTEIRLYGLMTEPEEKTTVFTMFGSLPEKHQWMIVKVDLRDALGGNCTEKDFKLWSPLQKDEHNKYVPCLLGKQKRYKRKISHAACLVGVDFDPPITEQPCECELIDYECDFGFVRRGGQHWQCVKNSTLVDDPYGVPPGCAPGQTYNRTKGYRKISGDVCIDGFVNQYHPDVIPCPTRHVSNMLLYAKREHIVQVDLLTLKQTNLEIPNLKNVIAIDFDLKNNCVYWADIVTDTIARFCDAKGTPVETLVASDLTSVEGMALDWVSNNLYFVDGMRAAIELIRTDIHYAGRMRRTILDKKVLLKPRGIAVHPRMGYLYWTDWASANPSVKRSNLDGSYIVTIADSNLVEWPNGITIDYIADRVYWVDARKDYIGSADVHGKDFKQIPLDAKYVSHPFDVAVFKDEVYWDDWRTDSVFMSNKDFGGRVRTLVANVTGLMGIKVIAHGTQHGSNKCAQTPPPCAGICVGSPTAPFYACLCPDGMEMKDGKCLCPGGAEPLEHFSCPKISGTCSADYFACKSGNCIPKQWKCDGENDCSDDSDEESCQGQQSCPANYFVCSDGKCIPHYWKCDYERDCSDGSDEANCTKHSCSDNQFTCANGRCVSMRWKCDGENDCRDNSDEKDCAPNPGKCKEEEFQCVSGDLLCISAHWRCDGEYDCRDRSDEEGCHANHTCSDSQFSCEGPGKVGECIYNSWVCDGDKDCTNGADEADCAESVTPAPPYVNPFAPINGSACQEWMFTCSNHKCIPIWWKCDHANDCEDGSDELGCNYSTTPTSPTAATSEAEACGDNQFECADGPCISMGWVCDGTLDCLGGEDERKCETFQKCNGHDQFRCRVDGNCIPLAHVCDDKLDCPDGSDEQFCANHLPGMATPSCSIGYFPCDMNRCFPLANRCDSKVDCADGSDESPTLCSNATFTRVYQVLQMGVDARTVNATSALLYWWISLPDKLKLEFLPSVADAADGQWTNATWIGDMEYQFEGLRPNRDYNMTVYVRVNGRDASISPPAKYFLVHTADGVPSAPYNLTVQQTNSSGVLIAWNAPVHPNGEIRYYDVYWSPPEPPMKMRVADNSTFQFLDMDFEPSISYKFYVVAQNGAGASAQSEVVTREFHDLPQVQSLKAPNVTASSVSLAWEYAREADGFMILVDIGSPYPRQANHIVTAKNVTVDNLPPGVKVAFRVAAYKGLYTGPSAEVLVLTRGDALPNVLIRVVNVQKDLGNSVKISWERAKDARKANWVYGIYYGLKADDLLAGARQNTTDLAATVHDLDACESYLFSVGVIGPYGTGPILRSPHAVSTYMNDKAPPKKVSVQMIPNSPLQMNVQWAASCSDASQSSKQLEYLLEITDKIRQKKSTITVVNATAVEMSKVFNVSYGAAYDIRIRTNVKDSKFSDPVVYRAPPLMPPHSLFVAQEVNGSYVVYWTERSLQEGIGDYQYEVLVSEGASLNASTAARYAVKAPPFVFDNHTASMYSFRVRLKTAAGYASVLSEMHTVTNSGAAASQTGGGSAWSVAVPVCLLIAALVAAFGFLAVKYRRLQHSFTRFANSHYDTRSEAATFDDNILDEDDTPQIRGFSDDEPLVVA